MSSKVVHSFPLPAQADDVETAERNNVFQSANKGPEVKQDRSGIAVRISKISKCFHIYDQPQDRLKQSIMPRLQRYLGQPPKQYFREFWALRDISFEIKKGETVGIIGRNGSGKSTLLQIICGILTPTSGEVETHGRVAALLELGSGFNPEFTGRENVYMNAAVIGLNKEETDACFDDIVAFADIGEFIEQPVKTYSSGMVVRLAFAVIAHVNADILIIDEALSVGDAFFVQKCMRFLRGFMKKGTVLFVSHDTGAVVNLCSHALWLQHGVMKLAGSPKEVSEQYLEVQYQSTQGEIKLSAKKNLTATKTDSHDFHDVRRDLINATSLRNDIEVFKFNPDASSFGSSGGKVVGVCLKNTEGESLSWIVGGEGVQLSVLCRAEKEITNPIIGFYLKDRLGQILFGDNTFVGTKPINVKQGGLFQAVFHFRVPILPPGKYSFCAALAEGTQANHVQHHWIHDALMIVSHASSVTSGLIGIPMRQIDLHLVV